MITNLEKTYHYGNLGLVYLYDLILYVPSTIFQLNRDGSSCVDSVLSEDKCVLLKDHDAVTPVRFELTAPRSRVSEWVGKYGVQVQSVLLTSNY